MNEDLFAKPTQSRKSFTLTSWEESIVKIGMVLEGGAMRGMYTAGVLDTLMDEEVPVDAIVGVSAGALFGVNYLSRQRGRVIRYNKRFNRDPEYLGLRPLLREGNIVSTDYAYWRVPRQLDPFDDKTFRQSGVPFYAVVTNVATGGPEYIPIHSVFDQMDVLRASGSMPAVSRPVSIGGEKYLDGGISDSIPFEWMAAQGCDKLIVVLTRDDTYRKKSIGYLGDYYRRSHPKIAEALRTRHQRYNASVEILRRWETEGKAFVIRPTSPIVIGTIEKNPDKLQAVYDMGTADAKAKLAELKAYLEK